MATPPTLAANAADGRWATAAAAVGHAAGVTAAGHGRRRCWPRRLAAAAAAGRRWSGNSARARAAAAAARAEFHERVWGMENLSPWFPGAVPSPGKKLGEAWFRTNPPLPILVKFLFAAENLSVQVHPEGDWGVGKTEMWRILRAAPGARIALGFERAAGLEELRAAALSGEIEIATPLDFRARRRNLFHSGRHGPRHRRGCYRL